MTHYTPHPYLGPLTSEAVNARLAELSGVIDSLIAGGTVAAASSVLSALALAGQPDMDVIDAAIFAVGQTVYIGHASGSHESGTIDSISSDTITLDANLGNTYAIGTPVTVSPVEVVEARGTFPTLAARLAGIVYVNVKSFGATGDNATNDTESILLALSYVAAAGGGIVYFPPGTYLCTRLAIPDFVHLRGAIPTNAKEPVSKVKLMDGTDDHLFYLWERSQGVTFQYLDIDGNKANNSGTSHCIYAEEGDGIVGGDKHIMAFGTIKNCQIHDAVLDDVNIGWSHATFQIIESTLTKAGRDCARMRGDTSWIVNSVLAEAGRYALLQEGPVGHLIGTDVYTNNLGVMVDLQGGDGPWGFMILGGVNDHNVKEGVFVANGARYVSINGVQFNANGSKWPYPTIQSSLASNDIINSAAHGYSVDDIIWIRTLSGGTGLAVNQDYYIIEANFGPNAFQVSLTEGGAAVGFSSNISSGTTSLKPAYSHIKIEDANGVVVDGCTFLDDAHPAGAYSALYDIELVGNAYVNGLNVHAGHYVSDVTNARSGLRGRVGGRTFVDGNGDLTGRNLNMNRYSADATGALLALQKSRSATFGGHAIANISDAIGQILATGSDGTTFRNAALIDMVVNGPPSAGLGHLAMATGLGAANYLRLSETTGAFTDSIGALSGTANGTMTRGAAPGALYPLDSNACVDLDGASGYIDLGDNYDFLGNQAFTVAGWLYPDTLGTGMRFASKNAGVGAGGGWEVHQVTTTSTLRFLRHDSVAVDDLDATSVLTAGAWHHIVATYDGATMTLYLNGAVVGTPLASSRVLPGHATSLKLGRFCGAASGFFNGKLDEVAFWSRALSPDEVVRLYNSRLPAQMPGAIRAFTAQNGNGGALREHLRIDNMGTVHPGVTANGQKLGDADHKWSEVFAVNGVINTSDEREKDWRGGLTKAEQRVAKRLSKSIGIFKMKEAIERKGRKAARQHAGVAAQDVAAAFAAEGLDASKYGMFCYDEWEETVESTFTIEPVPCIYGDDDKCRREELGVWKFNQRGIRFLDLPPECPRHDLNQVMTVEGEPRVQPAGNVYGVRTDELAQFVIAGIEERLAALEAGK